MGGSARDIRRFAIGAGMAALLWLLFPAPASAGSNPWSGTWQTAWTGGSQGTAEMDLTQDGTTVSGTYDHLSGTIEGTVTGDQWDGTWTQNNDTGGFSFVLAADGKSWSGTWTGSGGGGDWAGTCSAGDCLAASAAPSSSTTATTTSKRPTAVAVQCDRDTNNTTNAHFDCRALVNDIGQPAQSQKPSGTVTWSATKGQFLSGNSCALVIPPDVGASSCVVGYDATNEDAPIGTALPVTASYGGDALFAASSGVHALFPGPASSGRGGGGIPGWAIAAGAGGVVVVGFGVGLVLRSSGAGAGIDSLVGENAFTDPHLLETLGIDPSQFATALDGMTPLEVVAAQQLLSQAFANALGIPDPSVVAHMTRAEMEHSLQQLSPGLVQALGYPDPASTSNMTPEQMKDIFQHLGDLTYVGPLVPAPPVDTTIVGGTGLLHTLGFSAGQLNAAVAQMSPMQVVQVLQQLQTMFAHAAAH